MDAQTKRMSLWIAATAFTIGLVIAGQFHRTGTSDSADLTSLGFFGFDTPRAIEPVSLMKADGQSVSIGSPTGKWSFMFFGFTSCPDVCPTTLSILNIALSDLADSPQVTMVSVDPARDTIDGLKQYVTAFNPAFSAATGPEHQIRELADQLGIAFSKSYSTAGDDYTVQHSGALVVIDPAGDHAGYIRPPLNPERLRKIAIALTGENDV